MHILLKIKNKELTTAISGDKFNHLLDYCKLLLYKVLIMLDADFVTTP